MKGLLGFRWLFRIPQLLTPSREMDYFVISFIFVIKELNIKVGGKWKGQEGFGLLGFRKGLRVGFVVGGI